MCNFDEELASGITKASARALAVVLAIGAGCLSASLIFISAYYHKLADVATPFFTPLVSPLLYTITAIYLCVCLIVLFFQYQKSKLLLLAPLLCTIGLLLPNVVALEPIQEQIDYQTNYERRLDVLNKIVSGEYGEPTELSIVRLKGNEVDLADVAVYVHCTSERQLIYFCEGGFLDYSRGYLFDSAMELDSDQSDTVVVGNNMLTVDADYSTGWYHVIGS
jgi:hypothetical protein